MTINSAQKRAARILARERCMPYRQALADVRDRGLHERAGELARHVLIEAVEGCGIGHWARVVEWDGRGRAVVVDLGGESYRLDEAVVAPTIREMLDARSDLAEWDVLGDTADEIVQTSLFGLILYRPVVRHRPGTERFSG